jgi:hypothetical protein
MPTHQFDTIFEFLRENPEAGENEVKNSFPELDEEIVKEACKREGRSLLPDSTDNNDL